MRVFYIKQVNDVLIGIFSSKEEGEQFLQETYQENSYFHDDEAVFVGQFVELNILYEDQENKLYYYNDKGFETPLAKNM